jgi:NADPH-dependent curcumin reductase CurA
VIGTAGSPDKRDWVRDVAGFDESVGHYDDNVRRRLRELAPDGYNVVFDNVGGARMEGFLLYDFEDRFPEARRTLLGWYTDGSLHVEHDVLEGLDHAPLGLRRLFDGRNLGKQILHVADPA